MTADPVPSPETLHFDLRVSLTLEADGMQPSWQAVLVGHGPGEALRFASMAELIRYLAQLGSGASSRGIR